MESAFWREVRSAILAHGDAGYTGTIADKWEYVLVPLDPQDDVLNLARRALDFDQPERDELLGDLPLELENVVTQIAELCREKWGPAVAIELSERARAQHVDLGNDRLFVFFGWAPT